MARSALWTAIAQTLSGEIASGHYSPGQKLPTEAELARRFGVNRHTVRRALGDLAERGLTHARRGSGVFVMTKPTDYKIGRRVRFHQNIRETGRTPERQVLVLETRKANDAEAQALKLESGDDVHVCEGVSLIDNTPIALFQSVFPAARFGTLLDNLATNSSVTAALRAGGVEDYTRATTRIDAKIASETLAQQLRIQTGSPLLRTTGVNVDEAGQPVEYGRTWFAAERVTLTFNDEG